MQLTKNFSLAELIRTSAPFENYPQAMHRSRLKDLAVNVLQPLREKYGRPIIINSGYRSPLVNKYVGSKSENSQHTKGEAADITTGSREENAKLYEILKEMEVDQCINEYDFSWIHVSFRKGKNRNQFFKIG